MPLGRLGRLARDSDLGLVGHGVDILADPGIGRAGGVGGAGELAGELPRRVKPEAVPQGQRHRGSGRPRLSP